MPRERQAAVPKMKQYDEAEIAHWEAMLAADHPFAEFYQLADVYTRTGRFLDAIQVARQGLQHYPQQVEGYVALGRAFFGAGNLPKAIKALRRALSFEQMNAEPYRLLGEILLWQQATAEALALLEEAVSRGYKQRSILKLLQRTREALDKEKTGLRLALDEGDKGIGNRAVSGTIGADTGERSLSTMEVTRQLSFPEEEEGEAPAAEDINEASWLRRAEHVEDADTPIPVTDGKVASLAGQGQVPKREQQLSIDDLWEHHLDQLPADEIEPDMSTPRPMRPPLAIPLYPLPDPLSAEIPPLPPEEEDSGLLSLPGEEDSGLLSLSDEEEDSAGEDDAPHEGKKRDRTQTQRLTKPAAARAPGENEEARGDVSATRPKRSSAFDPFSSGEWLRKPEPNPVAEQPAPAVLSRVTDRPDLSGSEALESEAGESEPTAARAPQEDRRSSAAAEEEESDPFLKHPTLRLQSCFPDSAEEVPPQASPSPPAVIPEKSYAVRRQPPPAERGGPRQREEKRPQRVRTKSWFLFLAVLVVVTCTSSFFFWRRHFGQKSIEQVRSLTTRAIQSGTQTAYQEAIAQLDQMQAEKKGSPQQAESRALLAALSWLQFGTGQVTMPASFDSMEVIRMLQAITAIQRGDFASVEQLLAEQPADKTSRLIRNLILAWANWLGGRPREAQEQLDQALAANPQLIGAYLLRGHLYREARALQDAAQAYRQGRQRDPTCELAAYALAAVLLQLDPHAVELTDLLKQQGQSQISLTWQRLVRHEHALLQQGSAAVGQKIQATLATAPPDPALLFYGAELLIRTLQFEGAQNLLDRLSKLRSANSMPLQLLAATLHLNQGLETLVIEQLAEKKLPPRGQRLYARALIEQGRVGEALKLIKQIPAPTPDLDLLYARALARKGSSLAPLSALAQTSDETKLLLAAVLLDRQQVKSIRKEDLDALVVQPDLRLRALTLRARMQLATRQLEGALVDLEAAAKLSAHYMPAREELGKTYLLLGRFAEAAQVLTATYRQGRRTPTLLLELARALALTGKTDEARRLNEEAQRKGARARLVKRASFTIRVAEGQKDIPEPSLMAGERDLVFLLSQASYYRNIGLSALAEKVLKEAAARETYHPLPFLRLGELYHAEDKPNASFYFEGAIERLKGKSYFPSSFLVEAYLELARYLLQQGQTGSEVKAQLIAAREMDPEHAATYRLLGMVALKEGHYQAAREALERCVTLNPADADAFFLLGLQSKSEAQRARQALQRFLELEPRGKRAVLVRRELKRHR